MPSGGGGSSPSTTTTVQKADPWAGQMPYLQGGTDVNGNPVPGVFQEAAKLYQNNPLSFYPGQTYASPSDATLQAQQMQADMASQGVSGAQAAADQNLQDTLSGKYLDINTNSYLMPAANNILATVLPQINSQFAASGRGNSGLAARAASQGATDALATQAFNNYNNERQRQMQAAQLAPAAMQADYLPAAKLAEVGASQEDRAQQAINEAMQRFQFNQQAPYQQLGLYNSLIQGNYGGSTQGTSTSTLPPRSIGAGLIGGGVAGAGLGYLAGSALGLTPGQGALYGGLAGGAAGGLL